jgi:hypothetical protein
MGSTDVEIGGGLKDHSETHGEFVESGRDSV